MPRFSVWTIRLALAYLAAGFTLGALMLAQKGIPYSPAVWQLLPIHIEILLFGWIWELAMGVAYWILPRFAKGSARGNKALPWVSLILLNSGIWLIGLNPFVGGLASIFTLAGRVLETSSAALFAIVSWKRIRPTG